MCRFEWGFVSLNVSAIKHKHDDTSNKVKAANLELTEANHKSYYICLMKVLFEFLFSLSHLLWLRTGKLNYSRRQLKGIIAEIKYIKRDVQVHKQLKEEI